MRLSGFWFIPLSVGLGTGEMSRIGLGISKVSKNLLELVEGFS